jgi:hypothetical protein
MRSNEPRAGAPANGGRDKDLLAELARLTGRDDPYAALGHPGGWARPRPQGIYCISGNSASGPGRPTINPRATATEIRGPCGNADLLYHFDG